MIAPTQPIVVAALFLCAHAAMASHEDIFMRAMPDGSVQLSNVPTEVGFDLLVAASPARDPVAAAHTPDGSVVSPARGAKVNALGPLTDRVAHYRELIAAAAQRVQVDARLLHAVIAVESGYDARAVSAKGAIGLMQLMPATAKRYGVSDARDPQQNVLGGAAYLRELLDLFANDVSLALAAYNAGENAVLRHGRRIPPFRETSAYVPRVLGVYRKLEGMPI